MGKMTFQLPAGLPADAARELERSCLAGGPIICRSRRKRTSMANC